MKCGFLCSLVFAICCICCVAESAEDIKDVDMAWRGLDDSRLRIVSGVCTLKGTTTKRGENRDEDCLIAFDIQKGFYRFDRMKVANSLLTPEYYFECWEPRSQRAAIERQLYAQREPSNKVDLFDIRMLGFFTFLDAYGNLRYDKDTIANFLENKELVEFQQHSNGIISITYVVTPMEMSLLDEEKTRQTYWIDLSHGFSLIKVEYRHSDGDIDTTEITWKEKNNVWVPETCFFSSTQGFGGMWKFDWSLVNEYVPSHFFDVGDLSEVSVRLLSRELGEAIQIGVAGGGEESYLVDEHAGWNNRSLLFRYILMVLGLLLIVIALGKKAYDRRSRVPK